MGFKWHETGLTSGGRDLTGEPSRMFNQVRYVMLSLWLHNKSLEYVSPGSRLHQPQLRRVVYLNFMYTRSHGYQRI